MDQSSFDRRFGRQPPTDINVLRIARRALHGRFIRPFSSCGQFLTTVVSFIPILGWLPKYSIKNDLIRDIIGGLIVGIMHIPQGIAYSSLAGVPAVVGLYTSFFPPLIYIFFGTSRHISVGSFAVVALMAGNVVTKYGCEDLSANCTEEQRLYTTKEVASTLTLAIGIVQIGVGALGLSFMTAYFSDSLVAGFTTGASVHVLVTQLKDILGIYGDPRRSEWGQLPMKLIDLGKRIPDTNYVTLLMSLAVGVILLIGKYLINPFVQKKLKSPITVPFELIVVVAGTLFSYFLDLNGKYQVRSVGSIPTGMPSPSLPKFSLLFKLFPDAVSIAVVVLAIQISLAKMFSKKYKYPVDTTQEFYGTGLMCILSGFFPVYPPSPSLSRTLVNGTAGTRTQISALFSSALILVLCLFAGKYLNSLPMCILAVIIIIALIGMFEKFGQIGHLWKVSKVDFSIWIISFAATVGLDVVSGLIVAICFALFTTVLRSQCANLTLLAEASDSVFCDENRYSCVEAIEDVRVVRFNAPLIFTNAENFQNLVTSISTEEESPETESDVCKLVTETEKSSVATGIVIDCSPFVYIDLMGVETLKDIYEDMKNRRVRVLFAASPDCVRDLLIGCDKENKVPSSVFYPSVKEAVTRLTGRY